MNRMTATGLIAGGMLGAAGLTWVMADKNTRKRFAKNGGRMMKRAGKLIDM